MGVIDFYINTFTAIYYTTYREEEKERKKDKNLSER